MRLTGISADGMRGGRTRETWPSSERRHRRTRPGLVLLVAATYVVERGALLRGQMQIECRDIVTDLFGSADAHQRGRDAGPADHPRQGNARRRLAELSGDAVEHVENPPVAIGKQRVPKWIVAVEMFVVQWPRRRRRIAAIGDANLPRRGRLNRGAIIFAGQQPIGEGAPRYEAQTCDCASGTCAFSTPCSTNEQKHWTPIGPGWPCARASVRHAMTLQANMISVPINGPVPLVYVASPIYLAGRLPPVAAMRV
jgi:hypothetical protein